MCGMHCHIAQNTQIMSHSLIHTHTVSHSLAHTHIVTQPHKHTHTHTVTHPGHPCQEELLVRSPQPPFSMLKTKSPSFQVWN